MITGDGGFVHRMMPPTDWDCGPIPKECYNPSLSRSEIQELLLKVYLQDDRVMKLAENEDSRLSAICSLEILAEIDSDTIWAYNLNKEPKLKS